MVSCFRTPSNGVRSKVLLVSRKTTSFRGTNSRSESRSYSSTKTNRLNGKVSTHKVKDKKTKLSSKTARQTGGDGVATKTIATEKASSGKTGFQVDNKTTLKSEENSKASDTSLLTKRVKRRLRVDIKLHPDDVTNKRLDDFETDGLKVKAEVKPKDKDEASMSINARFRAIKPPESILSVINENVIGRRRLREWRNAGFNTKISAPLDNIPFSESDVRQKIEENVFRNKLKLYASAKNMCSFPPAQLPEIAFAGRSNVGKSSLLNSITRQWGVVQTSNKPGLTQTIDFFNLGSKLCLVDLPGYGFAYAKDEVKEAWEEMVKEYVVTRDALKRVCLLIDSKWGLKPRDLELIELMESAKRRYQIVLTKTDLVLPMDVGRRATQIDEALKDKKSIVRPMMMVSSKTGAGMRTLRACLSKLTRFVRV
eukprot:TRINITY_DN6472_c0_g1_i1.p1 TRINITY_DN6472_c0_g1~~TRINITY_DN6472_c0_g1_i1.p1  ORF type:complete len:425 (-),score=60.04 TRINITY_DN6472_c0_g1_i1:369-1643(-)